MPKRYGIIIVAVVVVALGWAMFSHGGGYETVTPERGRAVQAVYATGEVEPVYWAKVAPQIAGRVQQLVAMEGQTVKAGDPLALLESDVEQAKRNEISAKLEFLRKERQRYETLSKRDHTSQSSYERIASEFAATEAMLSAQDKLLERLKVLSPIDGVVLRRDIELGEMAETKDVVYWVGQMSPLRVTAEVDEEDIPLVAVGQDVLIKADAFQGKEIKGTVSEITPKGDPVNKNFRVRVALPERTPLRVGMTVEVNIVSKIVENALLVPALSVQDDQVWVKAFTKYEPQKVTVGIRGNEKVQILHGLDDDTAILLNPLDYTRKK